MQYCDKNKIMIVTPTYEKVALLIEALFKLIYPLDSSSYITVGFISEEMIDFIHAPFPYIVGCPPKVFEVIPKFAYNELEDEVVIINFDTAQIQWKNCPKFPAQQTEYWKAKIEELNRSIAQIPDYENDEYIDISDESIESIRLQVMINLEVNMKIKKIFVNLMILMLGNYRDYFYGPESKEFDYEKYTSSFPVQNRQFYDIFVQTLMFHTFIKDTADGTHPVIKGFQEYTSVLYSSYSRTNNFSESFQGEDKDSTM